MTLEPPPTNDTYPDLNSLIKATNSFANPQGYAIVKQRTKLSKKGILRKAVLMCDRGGKYEVKGHGIRRSHATIKTGCEFQAVAARGPDEVWNLTIKNASHNHGRKARRGGSGGKRKGDGDEESTTGRDCLGFELGGKGVDEVVKAQGLAGRRQGCGSRGREGEEVERRRTMEGGGLMTVFRM